MHTTAGAECCSACNDHASVVLALLGTGPAAVDDQIDDVDDRPDSCPRRCGQHRSVAARAQLSCSCKPRRMWRMPQPQGRDPRLRLYASFDGGSGKANRTTRCRCWCRPRWTSTRPRRTSAQRLLWRWLGQGTRIRCRCWCMFLPKSNRNCTS